MYHFKKNKKSNSLYCGKYQYRYKQQIRFSKKTRKNCLDLNSRCGLEVWDMYKLINLDSEIKDFFSRRLSVRNSLLNWMCEIGYEKFSFSYQDWKKIPLADFWIKYVSGQGQWPKGWWAFQIYGLESQVCRRSKRLSLWVYKDDTLLPFFVSWSVGNVSARYLAEHRARMRAWRQGEVHLLVKEQVDTHCNTNTIIIIKIFQEFEAPTHQDPQECAVKAVRLERLVGTVTAPRFYFFFYESYYSISPLLWFCS